MIKKSASVVWTGAGKTGKGEMTTPSGILQSTPYSFATRFEDKQGTNPEELLGAAHAACFSMALSFRLEAAGFKEQELKTTAVVSLDPTKGPAITESALSIKAKIPGITHEKFKEIAEDAKKNCPVSKLFSSASVTLNAELY